MWPAGQVRLAIDAAALWSEDTRTFNSFSLEENDGWLSQGVPARDRRVRRQVLEDLPELDDLKDRALRNAAIEAWALSIVGSSFKRISEIPGDGNPGVMVLKRGTQDMHLRAWRSSRSTSSTISPRCLEAIIDRDIVPVARSATT